MCGNVTPPPPPPIPLWDFDFMPWTKSNPQFRGHEKKIQRNNVPRHLNATSPCVPGLP